MKSYTCGQELAAILLKNGFIETSEKEFPEYLGRPDDDGKRIFRASENINYFIRFDHGKIVSHTFQFFHGSINEEQLQAMVCFKTLDNKAQLSIQASYGTSLSSMMEMIRHLADKDCYMRRRKPKTAQKVIQAYCCLTL